MNELQLTKSKLIRSIDVRSSYENVFGCVITCSR
jgi:hypothetical protein